MRRFREWPHLATLPGEGCGAAPEMLLELQQVLGSGPQRGDSLGPAHAGVASQRAVQVEEQDGPWIAGFHRRVVRGLRPVDGGQPGRRVSSQPRKKGFGRVSNTFAPGLNQVPYLSLIIAQLAVLELINPTAQACKKVFFRYRWEHLLWDTSSLHRLHIGQTTLIGPQPRAVHGCICPL